MSAKDKQVIDESFLEVCWECQGEGYTVSGWYEVEIEDPNDRYFDGGVAQVPEISPCHECLGTGLAPPPR